MNSAAAMVLLFAVEIFEFFFRKENIQLSSRSFFPFPEIARDAQNSSLQSRWCLVYYKCRLSPQLETRVGGFASRCRPQIISDIR